MVLFGGECARGGMAESWLLTRRVKRPSNVGWPFARRWKLADFYGRRSRYFRNFTSLNSRPAHKDL